MDVAMETTLLDPDRLFPAERAAHARSPARSMPSVEALPIVSPHGHTDPRWFAEDAPFPDPAQLFVVARPLRLPHALLAGRAARDARRAARRRRPDRDRRPQDLAAASPSIITCSAARRRGSGSTMSSRRCSASTSGSTPATADRYYDRIADCLARPEFRPRALFERFRHRGDRDHREPARRPAHAPGDPRLGLERPGRHRLPARSGGRSRVRGLRRQPRRASAR